MEWDGRWEAGWHRDWDIDRHRHRHMNGKWRGHWDWKWAIHWHGHLDWHRHGSVNHNHALLRGWEWHIHKHFGFLGHLRKLLTVGPRLTGSGQALMGRASQGHVSTRTHGGGILETPHGVPSPVCCSHVMNGVMDG